MEIFVILTQAVEHLPFLIFIATSTFFCFLLLLFFPRFWSAILFAVNGSVDPTQNPHSNLPSGAGLVFSSVYIIAGLIFQSAGYNFLERADLFFYLAPLFVMSVAGFLDDICELPWFPRLVFYFLTSLCFVALTQPSGLLSALEPQNFSIISLSVSVFLLLWMTNLYNFMDGIDGLAASQAIFVLLSVSLISLIFGKSTPSPFLFFLIGPLIGFLVLNLPKAKILMGDSGSIFLGFFFGITLLHEVDVPVWCWLILLGWFIVDGTSTAIVRLLRGENLAKKHQSHAYQHLSRIFGVWKALMVVHFCNLFWLFPMALFCFLNPQIGSQIFIAAILPLLVVHLYSGAGQVRPHFLRDK